MTDCGHRKAGSLGLDMLHGFLSSELQIRFMSVLMFSLELENSGAEFPCKKHHKNHALLSETANTLDENVLFGKKSNSIWFEENM